MTKNEKLLVGALLKNRKENYRNINFAYSDIVTDWGDNSGSFDFIYEQEIDPKSNRSSIISEIRFYDVDEIVCEAILLGYINKQCLYCIDIVKLDETGLLIQLPTNENEFFIPE